MANYILSCCSACDLTKDIVDKYDIKCLSFKVMLDGKEYKDDFGKSITLEEFYLRMNKGAETKTSQLPITDYIEYFEPFLKNGQDIIHVCLSSGLSGTFNSATIAKNQLEAKYKDRKIYIIDSLCASSGYGLLMSKLGKEKAKGKNIDELAKYAEYIKLKINHWFFSSDLKFYIRGGRISKASGFVGTILRICPILNVSAEGKLVPREKVITSKLAQIQMVKKMELNCDNGSDYDDDVYISHSACFNLSSGIKKIILSKFKKLKEQSIKIFQIGTTIGAHTGPGTCALFFIGKERVD